MSQDFNLGITTSMDINNPLKQLDELENRLKQITNNINQLDRASDKAEKGTKNYGKESKELTDKFNKQEKTIKKLEQQLSKFNNEKKKSTTATKENKDATDNWLSSHSKSLQLAVESITIWGLATQAVYGTKRAFDEMVQTIKEVNTEMVSLQKVMNPAITDFQEMKNVASELGVEYAKSTQEVVRSMVDWGRQGKRQNEVIKLTEASLLAANVAEMEAADSVRYLTAATLQFNVDASDATEIVDKWNEVSNNFATTATDLAESIKEAGAAANNAGIAMDDLIGMTTALTASTAKSGNRIGNSLKTMFSRIRGDMGSESTEILGQVEKSLNDIGIALRVNQDTYRDTTNVLSDLALQWDSLDEVMRDNIARAIGGRRRYSDVISLMENWDIATDATRTSMNSLNSAVEENETYMESIEAQWNQAIQAGNKLSLTIGEAGMNDAIIKFSNTLESTFGFMENFVLGLTKMDQSVKALLGAGASGGIIILISKVGLLSKAFTALITSINPVVAGIGALVGITVTAISKWGEYQTRLENGKETYEEINEALERNNELSSTEVSQIDEKISKYLELTDTYDIAAEKINELYKNAPSEEEVLSAMFTEDNEKQLEKGRKNIEEMDKLGKEQKETIKELRAVFQDMSKQYSNDDNFLNAVKDDLFEYQQTLHNSISYIADFSKDHWKMLQQHRQENHLLQEKAETYNELMQKEKLSYVEQIRLKGVMDDLEN
ncbi:MAG: phage tail tape measure protein, partial [bacterium]